MGTAAKVGLYAATAPLSLLLSPVVTPIASVIFVKLLIDVCENGDLTPVWNDEDM